MLEVRKRAERPGLVSADAADTATVDISPTESIVHVEVKICSTQQYMLAISRVSQQLRTLASLR